MVFSSLSFLYLFLPTVLGTYFLFKSRNWRNGVLLIASLFFYAWGEPKFVLIMLLSAFVAFVGGLLMNHYRDTDRHQAEKTVYILTVVLLVGNLFYFKYFNFTVDNISAILGISINFPRIVLPIGISFFTFQILSYVIDLHRREITVQRSFTDFCLYVSLFPQLIAGPIVRYQTVEKELRERVETLDDVVAGLKRFIIGLSKKVIIANNVAVVADTIFAGDAAIYGSSMFWLSAFACTLQLYFDFSGYSDMAIGLGRIFGFHFLENFNYPYISCSIIEFWRRWHISLSSWFRDYLYIPMGGSRLSVGRYCFNVLVVWTITGFWHGAEWNYVLWGVYNALFLLIEKFWLGKYLKRIPALFGWIYTMFFVTLGMVLFYFTDLEQLGSALCVLFTVPSAPWQDIVAQDSSLLYYLLYIPLGCVCMLPICEKLPKFQGVFAQILSYGLHTILLLLCICFIISSSYNPFIYFRF